MAVPMAGQVVGPTGSPVSGASVTYKLADDGEPNANPVLGTTSTSAAGWWTFADVGTDPVDIYIANGSQVVPLKGLSSMPHSFGDGQISASANITLTKLDDGGTLDDDRDPASYTPTTLHGRLEQIISQLKDMHGLTDWNTTLNSKPMVTSGGTTSGHGPAWVNWTPTITQTATLTYSANTSRYCIIGKLLIAHIAVTASNTGTTGQPIILGGLPVASALTDGGAVGDGFLLDGATFYSAVVYQAGSNSFNLVGYNAGALGQSPSLQVNIGDRISATLMYEIA
jgi:hypothetical protein